MTQPHRRPRRLAGAAAALALVGAACAGGDATGARAEPGSVEWVWAGGTTTDRARVVAKVGDGARADSVQLLVGEDAGLRGAQRIEGAAVEGTDGAVVRFDLTELVADREHHYAVAVDGGDRIGGDGRFRTMPDGPSSFTLAMGACAETGSDAAVFATIRRREPLLYLNTGDFHYGDITTDSPARFREVLDAALTAPAQSALYRSTSVAYTWDDHDYGGNNSDSTSPSRAAAQQVYREYVPHHLLAPGDDGIYQSFTVGRARVVLTDQRSHRSPQAIPDGPEKTMLGPEQLAWFEGELRTAAAAGQLVLWVSSTPWISAAEEGEDHWGGYAHERARVADLISDLGLTDQLVVLGGDAHMVALDDGTNSDYSTAQTGGFPVLHAGALDRPGSVKGGPYSAGAFPGGGQFGEVEVHDDGGTVEVTLRGLARDAAVLVQETFDVTPTPP